MIYSPNRQNILRQLKARAFANNTDTVMPISFAEKHRSISIRTILLLAGCLLLLSFCAVSVMQIIADLRTEDVLSGAKAICQCMSKGAAVPTLPGSSN